MRALLAALGPIAEATTGELGPPDYTLVYQAGMDPAEIRVRQIEGVLWFQRDGRYGQETYLYRSGADPARFRAAVEAAVGLASD